ncbi:hypothetical protein [Winogradskyella sp.]|uniref:hypothetical protein n=1 Tax=Winogradskyella sp. TaxID=1883156 RepID=UPI0025FA54F5|nr:hypothetical protein [Winogradskyella sp.]
MKNKIFLLIVVLVNLNCTDEKKNDFKLLDDFIKKIVLTESHSTIDLEKYFDISNTKSIEILEYQIDFLKSEITKYNNYKIIKHSDLESKRFESNLEYKDLGNVYYLVCNGKNIAPLILKNEKLISISYALYKNESKKGKHPILLK